MWNKLPIRTVRFEVLVAVNVVLGLGLLVGLALDYRHTVAERLEDKRVALAEEAATVLPAVLALRTQGSDAIRRYIEAVCAPMKDAVSPGHHIVVELPEGALQARAHGRASPDMLREVRSAAAGQNDELVVGSASADGVTVHVSEYLADLRASLREALVWRLLAIIVIGLAAAVALNLILRRMVTKPLRDLVGTLREIGAGGLGARAPDFKTEELSFLAREISTMSDSLAEADRQRRWQMGKARRIQDHLHPRRPEIPGLAVAVAHEPADDVAGDYFDFLPLPDGSWLVCVADVAGHGTPAAMGAAILKAMLLAAAEATTEPGEILARVNKRYCEVSLPEDFATMLLVRWDVTTGTIAYANAGHDPGLVLPPEGDLVTLVSTGTVLGVSSEERWKTRQHQVEPGTRLLLVTDGVAEAQAPGGGQFGRGSVAQTLEDARAEPLGEVLLSLWRRLAAHRGESTMKDDTTAVAVEFVPVLAAHDRIADQIASPGREISGATE